MDRNATPKELLQAVLDSLPQHIAVLDIEGSIVMVNRAWSRFWSENTDDASDPEHLGVNYLTLCRTTTGPDAEQADLVARQIAAVQAGALPGFDLEYPCHSPTEQRWFILNATPLGDGSGGVVVSHLDITERVRQEEELTRLAHIDPLTGLANRRFFYEQSAPILAASRRHGRDLCLLFIDVDNFKAINDSWGHSAGDAVLTEIGSRLEGQTRASDLVARLGGDEFIVLLEAPFDDAIEIVAKRYQAALHAPIDIAGTTVHPSTSIGIAAYTAEVADLDDLIGRADHNMYHAKEHGSDLYPTLGNSTD